MKSARDEDGFRDSQRKANIANKMQQTISNLEQSKARAEFRGDAARAAELETRIRAMRKRALERMQ